MEKESFTFFYRIVKRSYEDKSEMFFLQMQTKKGDRKHWMDSPFGGKEKKEEVEKWMERMIESDNKVNKKMINEEVC